jgi:fermentation-respiration switch protein FrsA (DUF1100 family)
MLRGRTQSLHVYGNRGGNPVIVSSGDGGWIHLAPHVAELLASCGYFVVGFDSRSYLTSFTTADKTLQPDAVVADYDSLIQFAARNAPRRPLLIGVSEGAGLSVLAATGTRAKDTVDGVIALGLGNLNELGWRWSDTVVYLTHKVPHEPTFSSLTLIPHIAPLPFAAIHSTHDEFVPTADIERIVHAASGPAKLWVISALNHRFSGNVGEFDRRLIEAIEWVDDQQQVAVTRP